MLAEALRDWLPGVLQGVQPWMSAVDMQMGARWNVDLAKELEAAKVGIICVTPDNQTAPWMLFEAGALSKIVEAQCVIPYLLNLRPDELQGPLVQFQAAVTNRHDTFKLVSTINQAHGRMHLSDDGLKKSFDKWWPDLEATIGRIPDAVPNEPPPRPDREVLEEILGLIRQGIREQISAVATAETRARSRQDDLMVMTHQIQGPLMGVAASLTYAERQNVTGAAARSIEDAKDLIQDTIDLTYGLSTALSVAEGMKPFLNLVGVDVQAEVRILTKRLQRTNSRDDLVFSFREAAGFPKVLADKRSLVSVLYSLIHNVTKYADRNSRVSFECSLVGPDEKPVLNITSTGPPIHPEDRERIFERFARGKLAETGRFHAGVGLGLWVARELMRHLGGDLTLELSPQHPELSRFVVYFAQGA